MTSRTLPCVGCDGEFTVDVDQAKTRCPGCGTKYAAPWDDPEVVSSPVLSPEEIDEADAGAAPAAPPEESVTRQAAVEAPAGATVRITIDVLPE